MQIIELNFIQNIYFLLFLYYIFYNNILAQIRSYVIYRYYEGEFNHTHSTLTAFSLPFIVRSIP